jgi:tetratricopeptide (TPR) repeat protein
MVLDPDAVKLVEKLDGLPLALATAGAYLDQVTTSFADYLRLYEESWLKLQQTSPGLDSYENRALYSTWQLSFDHIKQQNELSIKLLKLWAYFDNQDLWFELLRDGDSNGPEWLSQLTQDELTFTQAVRTLCEYGLAEGDKSLKENEIESRGYSMHSCVHSWTIHVLNPEWEAGIAKTALECVGSHVPSPKKRKYWVILNRLIRYAARCWDMVVKEVVKEDEIARVLHSLADLYSHRGHLGEAEKMYQRALQGKEKAWGPEHTSTLGMVHNMGVSYAYQGKLDEAEKMYQRALQGKEKALGLEHTSTLDTVGNLGLLHADQGKLDEAEKMYQRALQEFEKAWGLEHTSILDTVNNLGNLYANQGKMDEAEKMYQHALQGYEKALGRERVKTYIPALTTMQNLAVLYQQFGRVNKANDMYSRALDGFETVLGRSSKRCQDILTALAALSGADDSP